MGRRLLAAAPPSSSFVQPQGLRLNKFDSLGARASSSLHAIRHVVRRRLPLASLAARLASLAPWLASLAPGSSLSLLAPTKCEV